MARALPDTLMELARHGGSVHVKCRDCGRTADFDIGELSRWFRARGQSDNWHAIRKRFRCDRMRGGCGSKRVEVSYWMPDPPPKDVPLGVDPAAWAKADERERKRLIRLARG
jgi:hypothetical protein